MKQRKHSEDDVEPEDDEEEFEIAEEKNVENELRRRLILKFGKKSKGESDELEEEPRRSISGSESIVQTGKKSEKKKKES